MTCWSGVIRRVRELVMNSDKPGNQAAARATLFL